MYFERLIISSMLIHFFSSFDFNHGTMTGRGYFGTFTSIQQQLIGDRAMVYSVRKMLEFGSLCTSLFLVVQCMGACKINFIIGSHAAFFSTANCIVPLSGAFLGAWGVGILCALRMLLYAFLHSGTFSLLYLVHVIPGLCAGYYWISRSFFVRFLVPLLCIALFVAHPIGRVAWVYSLYWFIPIILFVFNSKKLFIEAVGSTFVAHAVGSVIWLYGTSMPSHLWYALIPIVFFERLLIAFGMTLMYNSMSALLDFMRLFSGKYVARSA